MVDAPVVHEFQIRESDPWYGEFVTTEGETWFVFAHEFKAYREVVSKSCADLQAKVADVQAGVSALEDERDTWKRIAERAGVCMTCALGAPDISIGCTDCLNTGFEHGAPEGYVSEGFHAQEVAKLQAMRWSPIESAPKDGKHVLVARVGATPARGWFEDGRWWMHGCGPHSRNPADLTGTYVPTRWQPLPEAPSA